jgi:gluconolactonase
VTPDGEEVDVYPIPGNVTTNLAFGGADGRRAVISLSGSGQLAETRWPRPGLKLQ